MSAPFKKNDDITLEITSMNADGAGVGRYEGFAVFVPFALPGETVKAHVIKVASNYAAAKLVSVEVPSPSRIDPVCPHFGKCGGCSLQHVGYETQLEYKRRRVIDALERIGGFKGVEVSSTVGMSDPLRYRNKGSFPAAEVDGRIRWGLYAPRSHRLIPAEDCPIESREAVAASDAVCAWANEYGIPAYDELTGKGTLRHIVTRKTTGGVSVTVVTTGALPHGNDLVNGIRSSIPEVKSIVHNVNDRSTNVIMGEKSRLVWGEERIEHVLAGLRFGVNAKSFLQVNTVQTERLYSLATEWLGINENSVAADLYCGIGTISLMLAKKARKVVGIEYVAEAVNDARENAKLNGLDNAEFFCGPAEDVLPRLVAEGMRLDAITLDPPRKGADPAVLDAIAASGTEKIAYVSCDPATLARDLRILCDKGYSICSVTPVDMFPMTSHVETVCCLYRQKKGFISVPYEPKKADHLRKIK